MKHFLAKLLVCGMVLGVVSAKAETVQYTAKSVAILMSPTWFYHVTAFERIQDALASSPYAAAIKLVAYTFEGETPDDVAEPIQNLSRTLLSNNHVAVVVIGKLAAVGLYNCMKQQDVWLPVICCGMSSVLAQQLGLIESPDHPGGLFTVTNVIEGVNPLVFGKLLLTCRPDIKKVLVPHTKQDSHVFIFLPALKEFLAAHDVTLDLLPVDLAGNVVTDVERVVSNYDLLLSLGNELFDFDKPFADLCKKHQKCFVCSNFTGRGLTGITYAWDPAMLKAVEVEMLKEILFYEKHLGSIPAFTHKGVSSLYLNEVEAQAQGYSLDSEKIRKKCLQDADLKNIPVINFGT